MMWYILALIDLIAQPVVGVSPLSVTVTCNGVASTETINGTKTYTCADATASAVVQWTAPTMNDDWTPTHPATPLTDGKGFKIYYGTNSAQLTNVIDVPDFTVKSHTVWPLTAGTWYFAMTAYNSTDEESNRNCCAWVIVNGPPPPPPPPPTGIAVCACNEMNGDRANFGDATDFGGCTAWRWMLPVATSFVRTDASAFWTPWGSVPATAKVYGSSTQPIGATTAAACKANATLTPKSSY